MISNCSSKWCSFFKAIHDQHRQAILELIRKYKKLNASQIISHLDLSQPTISHHLKILRQAEIIKTEKKGKEVFYSLDEKQIEDCCAGFMKHFS
ncbi:MAG: metalloregulator ArsR/SmtB family transcription factor [Patescibacteria group bacterium]